MKETFHATQVQVDIVSPITGEVVSSTASINEHNKYYSIRKITSRINAMDLFSIMEKTCRSSKDIHILNHLTELIGLDNKIRIDNISKLAIDISVSRVKLTKFLKLLVDNNFMIKLDVGIYFVNPLIFIGRRVKSNALREKAQQEWNEL